MNGKDNTVTSTDAEQTFDKIQHTFTTKILIQLGVEVMYLNIIKARYEKPTANIILTGETLKALSQRSETRKDVHSHHFYST